MTTILLLKAYLVNLSTEGGGGQKSSKFFKHSLRIPPIMSRQSIILEIVCILKLSNISVPSRILTQGICHFIILYHLLSSLFSRQVTPTLAWQNTFKLHETY